MHYINLISTTLLASAAASAIPGTTPVSVNSLTKRSEKVWDPKGNIKLTFSSESIKIGDATIDHIIGKLAGVCHETGQCETNELSFKSTMWTSNSNPQLKITLGPDGTYLKDIMSRARSPNKPTNTYPVWIRNGLIDLLSAAVKNIAKCEEVIYTNTCFGSSAMAYCPHKKSKHTNCEMPRFWGINYQTADAANSAPPAIALDLASEKISNAEICKTALEATGTVAGAVNGYAGSDFSLLSYACV